MARFVDAIDLPVPIETAFDYLADFSTTAEWDPGVLEARRLTGGRLGRGSRFAVVVSVLGRRLPLEYEITEYQRPARLVLVGGDASVRSIDEITFEARLELSGVRRLADPLLHVLFQHIGRVAVRGLRERMAQGAPGARASKPARTGRRGTAGGGVEHRA